MEYQEFILQKKDLYDNIIDYIDDENDNEVVFQTLLYNLNANELQDDKEEFKLLLYIINHISNHHHRYPTFIHKIERTLLYFNDYIKQTYSNSELFDIFKKNKRILYFLFKQQLINVDNSIIKNFPQNKPLNPKFFRFYFTDFAKPDKEKLPNYSACNRSTSKNYNYYFFPEIKQFLNEKEKLRIENFLLRQNKNIFENFESNRQVGENESYICQLIRHDSIEEFDTYINKTNTPLTITIPDSIFETNPFLMKNRPTLIEYTAFYGSIQIFQYLRFKGVKLTSSLWLYAIHGNNPDIIHLLEENDAKPLSSNYLNYLKESIKCHHNNIGYYILNNMMDLNIEILFINNKVAYGFHYHNYEFIQNFDNFQFIFYYACLYDYFNIVKYLVQTNQIDLNKKIILNLFFVLNKVSVFISMNMIFNDI